MRVTQYSWLAGGGLLLALSVLSGAGAAAEASGAPGEAGVWKEQRLDFDYIGFTDHYACRGLQGKVSLVLHELGARPDMSVVETGCIDEARRTDPVPGVRLQFASLAPDAAAGAPVAGAWKRVDLVGPGKLDAEECELMGQIATELLPHFVVRNVQQPARCAPHMRTRTALRLEVFAPLAPPAR
jgi:hypothetical protein